MDGHRNCLVIDDDKIALKLAATCCHELGLKVYIADTPAEAFDELKRRRYRLIVVDHHVHGIAGFEILDLLLPQLHRATIAVFTGDTSDQTRVRYETRGAMAFLYKPLSLPAMRFHLKTLLERS